MGKVCGDMTFISSCCFFFFCLNPFQIGNDKLVNMQELLFKRSLN